MLMFCRTNRWCNGPIFLKRTWNREIIRSRTAPADVPVHTVLRGACETDAVESAILQRSQQLACLHTLRQKIA